jgi:hypothetical protein
VNPRLLRLFAILLGDAGLILLVVAFVFRLGLDSIVTLVALPLTIIGLLLWFRWFSLKAKESSR